MRVATLFANATAERRAVDELHAHGLLVARHPDIVSLLTSVRRGAVDAAVIEDNERQLPQWMSALEGQGAGDCPTVIVGPGGATGIARALQFGAADYAVDGDGPGSIAARLHAQWRRRRSQGPLGELLVGGYQLKVSDQSIAYGGCQVALTRCEFGMGWLLFRHCGHVVNLRTLASEVWGREAEISKRTMEQHAYRLRRKISQGLQRPVGEVRIRAVYGVGYRLEGVRATARLPEGGGSPQGTEGPSSGAWEAVAALPYLKG